MMAAEHEKLGLARLLLERGFNANATGKSNATASHFAAQGGDGERAILLLGNGATTRDSEGRTPFMWACHAGHLDLVRLLVKHSGPHDLDEKDNRGCTGLHCAAEEGHEEVVAFLLGQGPQANSTDNMDRTPLILASMGGHLGVVRMLAQHMGTQGLHETDIMGWTALYYAAREGHEEAVAFLLGMGAYEVAPGSHGDSSFLVASMKGHLGVVRLLAQELGPEGLDKGDDKAWTALHHAAEEGHCEVVAWLLEQGAQAYSFDNQGRTPLILASFRGYLEVVRVFTQHMDMEPEGLDDGDNLGWTALHHAARQGHEDVVAWLVERGAQADSREEEGRTPLVLASRWGCMGVVRFLAEHLGPGGLEEGDEIGWTPLHHAAVTGQEEVVAFLLSKGAQASTSDTGGETPFMSACRGGRIGVVRLLLQHIGTQALMERDDIRTTALHYAAYQGREEVVRFLLLAGADPTIMDIAGRTARALAEEERLEQEEEDDEYYGIVDQTGKVRCVGAFEVGQHTGRINTQQHKQPIPALGIMVCHHPDVLNRSAVATV